MPMSDDDLNELASKTYAKVFEGTHLTAPQRKGFLIQALTAVRDAGSAPAPAKVPVKDNPKS